MKDASKGSMCERSPALPCRLAMASQDEGVSKVSSLRFHIRTPRKGDRANRSFGFVTSGHRSPVTSSGCRAAPRVVGRPQGLKATPIHGRRDRSYVMQRRRFGRSAPLRHSTAESADEVLLYAAGWCPYSREVLPTFLALARRSPDSLHLVDLSDVDDPQWDERSIEVVPTLVAYREGVEIGRLRGPFDPTEIRSFVQSHRASRMPAGTV